MAAKLRKREEIPAQYKWDLSHIYPDDAAWKVALADVLASGKEFAAWEGKVAENPRQAIREYFDLNQQAEPVFSYAFLRGETATRLRRDFAPARPRWAYSCPPRCPSLSRSCSRWMMRCWRKSPLIRQWRIMTRSCAT